MSSNRGHWLLRATRISLGTPKIGVWDPQGVPGPQVKNHWHSTSQRSGKSSRSRPSKVSVSISFRTENRMSRSRTSRSRLHASLSSVYITLELYRAQPGRPKAYRAAPIVKSPVCAYWVGHCRCWLVCSFDCHGSTVTEVVSLTVTEVLTKTTQKRENFFCEVLWSWNLHTRSSSVFDVFCWSPFIKEPNIFITNSMFVTSILY